MRLPTLIMKLIKENWTSCPKVQAVITPRKAGLRVSSRQSAGSAKGVRPAGQGIGSGHRLGRAWLIGQEKWDRGAGGVPSTWRECTHQSLPSWRRAAACREGRGPSEHHGALLLHLPQLRILSGSERKSVISVHSCRREGKEKINKDVMSLNRCEICLIIPTGLSQQPADI